MTLRLTPDPSLSRLSDGRTLLGGTPTCVLRLTEQGARLVAGWLDGEAVPDLPQHRKLAGRLVRRGMAHPVHTSARLTPADVTAVIPVRDHPAVSDLPPLLADCAAVVIVDDGSAVPLPGAAVRHAAPRGPAAARNSGRRLARTELVAFLDADVVPDEGWLEALLPHFEDPAVAAVAPRVRSRPGPTLLERYETERSPLDLGPLPAPVRPGSRVGYVPTAALVVRTSALKEHHCFDETLRYGEDVDLVWRLNAAGAEVRYEPASVVRHTPRADWTAWARQRFGYGTSAAPLSLRHGKAAAPVRASAWSLACWAALAAGHGGAATATALTTAALLPRKLRSAGVPTTESLSLALRGHWGVGRQLADATTRAWWPAAVPALVATRRGRWLLTAALGRHVLDWHGQRPAVGLPQWVAVRVADDLAYGAGVWWGALRHRTTAPLRPDASSWPGRDGVRRI
ncbi:mycofactocin biosynthesis glycosyltransferase MftF [Streptomyces agglomeratus]|uniref:mycofactocin biosynthesis glycosyltransferase MftF n=1 Tax=Streptomyces agglomeratus TaxID=285458 RepID=UPI000854F2EE|nr:mycofactocin biosynthesis glycosyltransferase MftF [Streptomyces agglomeratus]OEJ36256.1 mycofactocin system glycosyltransferase [Streptomyces agglomeratus]